MTQSTCPVCDTITAIKTPLDAGRVKQPRARRILDDILNLIQDIAWGRAGDDHLPAIFDLVDELSHEQTDPRAEEIARRIQASLEENSEVFQSHIQLPNRFITETELINS